MDQPVNYIPMDRRQALARGEALPDSTTGTALFADISGFTPLTEALARELGPQRGAEELTRYLNQVYDVLIAEVDRYGGSVTGFSGDAITCWFDGDPGLRAVTSSLCMQRAMEQFRGLHLSTGSSLTLAMKCALASGPVRRFLVGDPAIQLLDTLAGDTLDRLAATEHQAQRGEVVLSAECAAALAKDIIVSEWRTDKETGGRFAVVGRLVHEADPMPWPDMPQMLDESQTKPWLLAPIYERINRGDAYLADLRTAVAMFLRFGKIDYEHDPLSGQKLDAYIRWVQGVVTRYGGFLLELTIGDKGSYMYLSFGAPVSYDDNSSRAVAAARLLISPPPDLGYITSVQIGLSEGQMRAGPYGGSTRRSYGVIGDEANLAARLMQYATLGQVVLSKRVTKRLGERFSCRELGSVQVKGKQDPIPVFELVEPGTALFPLRNEEDPDLAFWSSPVGRTVERSFLTVHLWKLFMEQVSSTVLLIGEAGIGKSRLVSDLLHDAQALNLTTLVGTGDAIEKQTPYHPWRSVFSQLFRLDVHMDSHAQSEYVLAQLEDEPDLLQLAPLLNPVLALDLADNELTSQMIGQVRADNTHRLLTRLLQRAALENPLVLITEDAHWLDSASWALLLAVKQTVQPVMQIISTRPLTEPLPSAYKQLIDLPGVYRLPIEPLSPGDIDALICSRLGVSSLPSPVRSLIREKAEGHPFFSEELAYALRDSGLITVTGSECCIAPNVDFRTISMPDTVQGVITSRIDCLPPAHQLTLKAASVVGRVFAFRLLRDIHPLENDRSRLPGYLGDLEQLDMTLLETPEPNLAYFFKHAITQEVAYNLMLFAQRRDLHRLVAEWYEKTHVEDLSPYYSLLAYHWDKAEVPVKAIEYQARAGEQAYRNGAYREAVEFSRRALELDKQTGGQIDKAQRAHWLRLIGESNLGIGNVTEARQNYVQGLDALGMPMPAGLPGLGLGIFKGIALQFLHRILPSLFLGKTQTPQVNREASLLYVKIAVIDYLGNETMLMMYEALHNLNVAEGLGPSLALAGSYASMGLICGFIPLRGLAENYMRLSLATIEAGDQPYEIAQIYEYYGVYQSGAGNLQEANRAYQYAVDTFKRIGDNRLWEETATLLSMILMPQGEIERSTRLWEQLYQVALERGSKSIQCWSLVGQAEIAILRGEFDSALDWLERARPLAEEIGVGEKIWLQGLLARLYWRSGREKLARQAAEQTAQLTAKAMPVNYYAFEGYSGQPEVWLGLLEADQGSGSLKQSARQAIRAMDKFARVFPLGQSRALLWKGLYHWLTGNPSKAHKLWNEALSTAQKRALPYDQALAHYEIGRHLQEDDPARREHLRQSLELFDRLGAVYDRGRVQAALDQT